MWKVAPLKSSFMLASIIGFLISLVYGIYGRISADWAFALCFLFFVMFIAAMISMTKAPIELQLEMSQDLIKPAEEEKSSDSKGLIRQAESGPPALKKKTSPKKRSSRRVKKSVKKKTVKKSKKLSKNKKIKRKKK